jgi:hypothetical protein
MSDRAKNVRQGKQRFKVDGLKVTLHQLHPQLSMMEISNLISSSKSE